MFWSIFKVTIVILIIITPIFILNRHELFPRGRRKGEGWGQILLKVTKTLPVIVLFMIPVYFLSDSPYAFYTPGISSIKLAFKHSGRRVKECDEVEFIQREAERYRRLLKETRSVEMDIDRLSGCSRERFPVKIELFIDGRKVLDKEYPPTGIRRDMASYIFENFFVESGTHTVRMRMKDSGPESTEYYDLEDTVELEPGQIGVIRFDDRLKRLVIE